MKYRHMCDTLSFICVAVATVACGQPGQLLPARDPVPRTKAEYEALSDDRAKNAKPLSEDPEHALAWNEFRARTNNLLQTFGGPEVVVDARLADQLVAELWVDVGHPSLNGALQDFVIDLIGEVVQWPDDMLARPARDRLLAGLRAYIDAGGGQHSPPSQALIAGVLRRAANDESETAELADALLTDAVEWVDAIDSPAMRRVVLRSCLQQWGELASWRLFEIENKGAVPPEAQSESYDKAVAALRALLQADPPVRPSELLERLRDAERAASVKQKDDRLNDDLVCRLLIVYRTLLDRRPRIAFRASAYIENQLLTLHTKGRLRTDRHWDLWAQAVKALEAERLSKRFQRYLRARAEKKDSPAGEVKALEQLRPLLAE